jgi:type III secretion system low calcium response chaperone LcrH/SycD
MSTILAPEDFPSIYAAASASYEAGDYEKASLLFSSLTQSAPFEEAHWRGLASSKQMLLDYEAALHAWSIVALFNEQDPWIHFHAAECLLSVGQNSEARKALDMADARLKDDDEELRDKIELLRTIHIGQF